MQRTKHMSMGLIFLLGAQLLGASEISKQEVTESEINQLGKIDLQEHKIVKPEEGKIIGVITTAGIFFYNFCRYLKIDHELSKKADEAWHKALSAWCAGDKTEPFKTEFFGPVRGERLKNANEFLFGATLSVIPIIIGAMIDDENELFYRRLNCSDLHAAAAQNNTRALRQLCYWNYDVLGKDKRDRTPLMYAAAAGAMEATTVLLNRMPTIYEPSSLFCVEKRVITVDIQDVFGRTAAHYAALNGHGDILKTLINEYSATIAIADKDGVTVKMLIEQNPKLQEALSAKAEAKN